MRMVFNARRAYTVSFGSFLMMMTGWFWKNAASSGQNSSLMPAALLHAAELLRQMLWFPEFNIVLVDKRAAFLNLTLSSLADTLISLIQHCWNFTKSSYPGIQHCCFFAEWRILRNYIAGFYDSLHRMSWIRESTLQADNADFLKPGVLCKFHWFSRGQFGSKTEDSNADFLNVSGLPTPAMLFFWKCPSCQHRQCCFRIGRSLRPPHELGRVQYI